MLFSKKELKVLNNINCYESTLQLVKTEMKDEELDNYINYYDYWDTPLTEWYIDWAKEIIYKFDMDNEKTLYFFDNSSDYINCDVRELLNKLFQNYDIQDKNSFDEVIIALGKQINKKKLTKEEIELLKKTKVYDDLYDLAEENRTEADLEEYINCFSNLSDKFENYFFANDNRCFGFEGDIYIFVDNGKMFSPTERQKIIKQLTDIFEFYEIYFKSDFEEFKKTNNID